MSIKIYDGLRMPTMPMAKFQAWLDNLRIILTPIAHEKINKEIIKRAVDEYDLNTFLPNRTVKKSNLIISAWGDVVGEYSEVKKTKRRNPLVDVECEILFHFRGKFIYMIPYTEVETYKEIIQSLPNIQEYGYWNNTDKPEAISQGEWRQRRNTWNAILNNTFPYKAGLLWTLIGDYDLPIPDKNIIHYVPSWENRIKNVLFTAVTSYYSEPINITNMYDLLEWYRHSDEAIKLKNDLTPLIKKTLVQEITFNELLK